MSQMYTSDVKKDGHTTIMSADAQAAHDALDKSKNDIQKVNINQEMDKIVLKPILDYGAKLMNDKIIVKKVISNNEFIVFVEDLRMNLVLKQIPNDEDLTRWIKLPPHTNIVSIFDTFEHKDGDKQYKFSLTELSNNGDMYKYIQSLNLKLDITIPLSYMEVIYDCMIQLTLAMEFAHNNGLCHGNFSLSNVALSKDGDTTIYKIKNFAPGSSINLPMTDKWPFTRGRKNFKEAEKIEILMLKDIYSLGICLLELMIGRFSSKKFSISLDSLPLTWAEYQESTPLIQVLVECIQLDSISQRKGILTGIRQLLMKSHSMFFNKNYYKMGEPYIGKKSDILNKLAIAALFRDQPGEAEELWHEAIEKYPNHFDSKVNYQMYRWKYGIISDHELIENLSQDVFKNKYKGRTLEGIIHIALGLKEKGLEILDSFNNQYKDKTVAYYRDPSENLRRTKARNAGLDIYREVVNNKEYFFENNTIESGHPTRITHIQFTNNGQYMTTACSQLVMIWEMEPSPKCVLQVDITNDVDYDEEEAEGGSDGDHAANPPAIACLDNECSQLFVYTGKILKIKQFDIQKDSESGQYSSNQQPNIDILGLYQEANEKEFLIFESDLIEDMVINAEGSELRMYIDQRNQFYQMNYNIFDQSIPPSFDKSEKFLDKGIYQHQQRYSQYFDTLGAYLDNHKEDGTIFKFPVNDFRHVCALMNEGKLKYFYIYDVNTNRIIRKILKQDFYGNIMSLSQSDQSEKNKDLDPEAKFSSDAYDVDPRGQILVYAYGRSLNLQTIKVPDSIKKHMGPQYTASEHKYSPARVQEVKQLMRNKINRDLDRYYQIGDNEVTSNLDKAKQQILQLLTLKYNQMCQNKRIIQANDEFLTMSRILVKEHQPTCPIVGVQGLIKLQSFEKELQVFGQNKEIQLIQMVSQVPSNVMYLAIGGKIYKYNLVTKDIVFEFSSFAKSFMMLYDFDDKLIVSDQTMVRLWDFHESKEDIPQLVTVMESQLKVDCLKVNKLAEQSGERKGVYYYIIACQAEFKVYIDRLDVLLQGKIPDNKDQICSIEFGIDTRHVYFGTHKGLIYKYELPSPEEVRNEYQKEKEGEPPKAIRVGEPFNPEGNDSSKSIDCSVTLLYRIIGILEEDFFLMHVKFRGLKVWNQDKEGDDAIKKVECPEYKGQIDQIKATPDGKFVVVGFPDTGFIIFYRIEYEKTYISMLPNGKISMQYNMFETDDFLSSILFYNKRLNTLELYAIKWEFETAQLDMTKLRKLDDEKYGNDSDLPTSQRDSSSRRKVHISLDDVDGSSKKSKCSIF